MGVHRIDDEFGDGPPVGGEVCQQLPSRAVPEPYLEVISTSEDEVRALADGRDPTPVCLHAPDEVGGGPGAIPPGRPRAHHAVVRPGDELRLGGREDDAPYRGPAAHRGD